MLWKTGIIILFVTTVSSSPLWSINQKLTADRHKEYERGGFFEGDIRFPIDVNTKNGLIYLPWRWPNATVYYDISPQFTTSEYNVIIQALNDIEAKTCVQFRRRTAEKNFVYVQKENSGCWSYVGMTSRNQTLNLARGCVHHSTIVHEFIHAIGFYHQQSTTDRDNYVEIHLENVDAGKQHNFNKYGANFISDFGVGYDYLSVMHYYQYAFSNNGKRTITTKDASMQNVIGYAPTLSAKDIEKINIMYNCSSKQVDAQR